MTETLDTGAGTDICASCAGSKEATRRGSMKCRKCDSPLTRGKVRKYRLPLTVDEHLWKALQSRADRDGVSIYVAGRNVLRAALADADTLPVEVPVRPPVDPVRLAAAVLWMNAQGLRKPATIKTKSGLLAWCEQQGFEQ